MKALNTPYPYIPVVSQVYRFAARTLRSAWYAGEGVACPVCGRHFRAWIGGPQGACPYCASATRQKFLWLMLKQDGRVFERSCRILHFAPEWGLKARLRAVAGERYTAADLSAPEADVHTDICEMVFPDRRFDLVLCCHVLEHVPDDRAAMKEIHRVLRPGGTAFIQVPYNREGATDEDLTVTDPEERTRRFGQFDHLRLYGVDFAERLRSAGFQVRPAWCKETLGEREMGRYGLWDDVLFICTRD